MQPMCYTNPLISMRSSILVNFDLCECMGKPREFVLKKVPICCVLFSGAPNDGFLLNTLKTLFRLSRVFLDIWKCIISGAIKFVSVRSS